MLYWLLSSSSSSSSSSLLSLLLLLLLLLMSRFGHRCYLSSLTWAHTTERCENAGGRFFDMPLFPASIVFVFLFFFLFCFVLLPSSHHHLICAAKSQFLYLWRIYWRNRLSVDCMITKNITFFKALRAEKVTHAQTHTHTHTHTHTYIYIYIRRS